MTTRILSIVLALTVCSGCAAHSSDKGAQPEQERIAQDQGPSENTTMTYVGTAVGNVVYVPVKILYAGAGALTSGLAYVLTGGDEGVATPIWRTSVGGDYYLTPRQIKGEEPMEFAG